MNNPDYDEKNITVIKIGTFLELMEYLRNKPAIFIGNNQKSNFIALSYFLQGYQFKNRDEDYHNFLMWFACYINTSSLPFQYIEETYKDEAYDKFWEFYDMYLNYKENRTRK